MAELPAEGTTGQLPGSQSFESRVLSALDDIRAQLGGLDTRLQKLEVSTKPIWEQALAEIMDTRAEMRRSFQVLNADLFQVRTEQTRTDERLRKLEGPHS